MTLRRTLLLFAILWVAAITVLHCALNLKMFDRKPKQAADSIRIGFLPVTCHLTCPVTDFINRQSEGGGLFEPIRFSSWPELKEAFLSGQTKATFILAPMA